MGSVNLSGANLSGARLYATDLSVANLSGANLSNASMSCANLYTTDLSVANLSGANLSSADLHKANLSGSDLSHAILEVVILVESHLIKPKLHQAQLIAANLVGANLNQADLNCANLSDANLIRADLTDANLTGAKLDGTILAYQKVSEELQGENQILTERVKLLEAQLEKQKLTENINQASNQGIKATHQWNGFYFRSKTEIKIAEALDRTGVLFYPNSKARLNQSEVRVNKESDFLVFQVGKFGILEVDGRPYHQTAADDHERDRLFKRYGIRVIERFDATRCWNEPDKVVQEFLEILSSS
jgi:uncharacterized protein YjbI with pentapeptide repeats